MAGSEGHTGATCHPGQSQMPRARVVALGSCNIVVAVPLTTALSYAAEFQCAGRTVTLSRSTLANNDVVFDGDGGTVLLMHSTVIRNFVSARDYPALDRSDGRSRAP
jgi:hypothetical protein